MDTTILLISDGHQSHETLGLLRSAFNSKVLLLSLPPHTTNHLQPLDVGMFGPLQSAQVVAAKGTPIDCEMVVEEYLTMQNKAFTWKLILSAFKKMGIHPFKDD
ncbi:hypothetical protein K439DRAFT_1346210, partial [Ramaria rubella]